MHLNAMPPVSVSEMLMSKQTAALYPGEYLLGNITRR